MEPSAEPPNPGLPASSWWPAGRSRTSPYGMPRTVERAHRDAVAIDLRTDEVTAVSGVAGSGTGRGREIEVELTWTPADPLAVGIIVTARPDHPALPRGHWVVLRDFLHYGLTTPTGDGAVRIAPEGHLVRLTLARPGRPCVVAVEATVVTAFLDATAARLPVGVERSGELLDAVIARLLEG